MNYDLITTLGPATATEDAWQQLLEAGATAFRLNTSHLSLHDTLQWLERLRSFKAQPGERIPVTLDLQGSKWRWGRQQPQGHHHRGMPLPAGRLFRQRPRDRRGDQ